MPCTDGGPHYDEIVERNREITMLNAVLCGILSKHGAKILDGLDWKEIGVKENVLKWWWWHQKEDLARREREKLAKEKEKARVKALAKLTKKDRLLLGLDD
jgi:hypothetical protein